jgi:alcohol dehydrogenase YqhD (iron-dependent ADH family)
MKNFIYNTPTKVYFGKGQEDNIGTILKSYNAHKVLLHYGKSSVKKSGLLDKIITKLKEESIDFLELGGVEPNPKLSLVHEGVKLVKANNIDFILAIGGGSVLDSAKSIAVGSVVEHDPWLFSIKEKTPTKHIPVGVILTLAASGSDMSNSCVITNDWTKEKRGFNSEENRPTFAILNPELTYSVSKYQTACGIVDILMHTLERFISIGEETYLTDQISIAVMKSVIKAGKIAIENPYDYEARSELLWANSLSHNGLTSCGREFIMSVHQMEHEVSGMFDHVAHGAGLAALWPAWAMTVYTSAIERFKLFAYDVMEIEMTNNPQNDISMAILKLKNFFKSLGIETSLREFGIKETDLEELALNVTFNHKRVLNDIMTIDESKALEILKLAY